MENQLKFIMKIKIQMDHLRRNIQEDHYYAYGLKIAGISSKKLGDAFEGNLKNNNLYNDKSSLMMGILIGMITDTGTITRR